MMKAVRGCLCLLLAVASGRDVVTPVDKVISLLTKLSAQVQTEGVAEAASYDKYACFCKAQADDKVYVIAKSDKKIKELGAQIDQLDSEIKSLDSDVSKQKKNVEAAQKTQAKNQKTRDGEQQNYAKQRKDLVDAVTAVEGALDAMQSSEKDVSEQVSSLLQKLPAASLSSAAGLALIAQATTKKHDGPGDAHAYEYSSKEVIATLQSLTRTFKKELATLDEDEATARGSFEMAFGARANTIKALQKEINEKETLSASKSEEKSDADELKNQETTARNADQKFLDDLTSKCTAKAEAWDQRSTTRAEELTALTSAVQLLKGMGDLYNTNKNLVGFISKGSKASIAQHSQPIFLQLKSKERHNLDQDKLDRLASRISEKAHRLNSGPLSVLALQLRVAGPDHFVKVRSLIKDLISKLEADAKSEASQKSFCDKAMSKAIDKRDKSAANIEQASAQIDSTKSTIAQLKNDIANLAVEIANLNKELRDMTDLRKKEKADNEKTISNAGEGKKAIDSAIAILNKFYGSALLQGQNGQTPNIKDRSGKTVGDLAPDTFSSDKKYKGNVDSSKGIVGMLEVISSDFERTSKTTTSAEATSVKDFNVLKGETDKSIKDKAKLKKTKETDVDTKGSDLTGFEDNLKDAKTMNDQASDELDKLKSSCVEGEETYAERVKHRKDEIEALKNALDIFEDWQSF